MIDALKNDSSTIPLSFTSINSYTGLLTLSQESQPSNFNYTIGVIGVLANNQTIYQNFTLYDMRLYFTQFDKIEMITGTTITRVIT